MKEYCKALRKNRRACGVGATALREGLPVCRRHDLAETIQWQGTPDEVWDCPHCRGSGKVDNSDYGLYYGATLDECTTCHGAGYVFQKPP